MPYEYDHDQFDRIAGKITGFFNGFSEDLKMAGEAGAAAIVQTTLAGIADNDAAFAPYSASYQALIDAVGGKPQQTVNMRGVFEHDGRDQLSPKRAIKDQSKWLKFQKNQLAKGAGRRAYITVSAGGKTFTAQTKQTRPALGLTDPQSEMSVDLIHVEATDTQLTLRYEPRAKPYMVYHNNGTANHAPQRKWFSAKKEAVWGNMIYVIKTAIKARIQWFNDHANSGAMPSTGGGDVDLPDK